ncbi:MAG: RNA polymerase sigma factor [Planctomycetaceae bacterium]
MGAHRDDPAVELRRLAAFARRLAGAERGEDLAQEALAAALERDLPTSGPYLFGLLRNVARQEARASRRRRAREALAARPDRVESTASLALALERMRVVGEAVDALPADDRRLLRLRYYDGVSAVEIARREGVPPSTVRNRIRRALAVVRAALVRAFRGDPRRAFALPWLPPPARRGGRWSVAAGIALLLGLAGRGLAGTSDPPPPALLAPAPAPTPSELDARPEPRRAAPPLPDPSP